MGLIYEEEKNIVVTCQIKEVDDKIELDFYSNIGKLGMFEIIDGYTLTPKRLLQILQDRRDYSEDEL